MTYDITPNEYKLIETVRGMKIGEELVLRKQPPKNPKEYVVFVTNITTKVTLFDRKLDTT